MHNRTAFIGARGDMQPYAPAQNHPEKNCEQTHQGVLHA